MSMHRVILSLEPRNLESIVVDLVSQGDSLYLLGPMMTDLHLHQCIITTLEASCCELASTKHCHGTTPADKTLCVVSQTLHIAFIATTNISCDSATRYHHMTTLRFQ